ncbi:MAG: DUF2059 domain-containing protein [Sphingomicrobium sp.]
MVLTFLVALATATASPTQKPRRPVTRPPASKPAEKSPPVDPMAAVAMMNQIFDKFFPAGPEPDPVRMAAARGAVQTMFPTGAYSKAMTHFVDGMIDRGLDMSEADFAALSPTLTKTKKGNPPSTIPFRRSLGAKDPNFDAKLAAVRAFMGQTFVKIGAIAEPKFRDGMARALARRFTAAQIAEIDAFLATPTGAAYGQEMVGLWFEPDVLRGAFAMFPEMMKLLPDVMKDGAALDSQIKALEKAAPAGKKTAG